MQCNVMYVCMYMDIYIYLLCMYVYMYIYTKHTHIHIYIHTMEDFLSSCVMWRIRTFTKPFSCNLGYNIWTYWGVHCAIKRKNTWAGYGYTRLDISATMKEYHDLVDDLVVTWKSWGYNQHKVMTKNGDISNNHGDLMVTIKGFRTRWDHLTPLPAGPKQPGSTSHALLCLIELGCNAMAHATRRGLLRSGWVACLESGGRHFRLHAVQPTHRCTYDLYIYIYR